MKHYLPRLSPSLSSLKICSRKVFKLQKLFLLFLAAFVSIPSAQFVNAANQTSSSDCPPGFLKFNLKFTPSAATSSGNNSSSHALYQLRLLPDDLLSRASQAHFYPMANGGFGCAPAVFESTSAVLGGTNQASPTSSSVPYILLAVNLAFQLCISYLLIKQVRKNSLSDQDLSTIKEVLPRSISDMTAIVLIAPSKISPINPGDDKIPKPSLLAELERLFATQARQLSSLEQEIAKLRHEFRDAIKPTLESNNSIEYSNSLSSDATPVPDRSICEDPPESSDKLNDQAISIVSAYRNAFNRNDRSLLRNIYTQQLKITSESEEDLLNSSFSPTRLVGVGSGGSYLLVPSIDRTEHAWILPDWRTLESFNNNRPNKGIFSYTSEANLCSAELRQPAEVRQCGELWEVVTMGVIAVGG